MICGFIRLSRLCLIDKLKVKSVSGKIRFLFFRVKELGLSVGIYIVFIIVNITTYYYYYLLQLSFHSVPVVLTLVQTKQIRINIHKRNNTKTQ